MTQWANLFILCVELSIYILGSTASICGDPSRPDNGDVFVKGRDYREEYQKQSCYDGYVIACDSGFFRRTVKFLQPPNEKHLIICTEDLDGSLFGHTSIQLVCVKYTDGITNATFGIVWCLAGKWSPSIVCLPDTAPTELTCQNITSSVDNSTGIFNDSQGRKDQHAIHENDDLFGGFLDSTALITGVVCAAWVVALAPLLVFVLRPLFRAAKVDPRPDGFFGNADNGYAMNENKTTQMTTHV